MQVEAAGRQRVLGTLAAVVGFFGVAYALTGLLEDLEPKSVATAFTAAGPLQKELVAPARRGRDRIVLLADSTMMHKSPREQGSTQLGAALSYGLAPKDRPEVLPVVFPGFDLYDYWALADRIIDAEPQQIVLAVNLRNFDVLFPANRRRAELVGWIDPARIPEAFLLPLRTVGMSPDRVLLYVGFVQSGLDEIWADIRQAQARLGAAWKVFASSSFGPQDEETPMARFRVAARNELLGDLDRVNRRYDTKHVEWFYGSSLEGLRGDEEPIVVLAAAVERFEAAGIPVLVYVAPVNYEYIASLGFETAGFGRSAERIGERVLAAGGDFADFHDLLPDAKFNDPVHFSKDGRENGIRTLARGLAQRIRSSRTARD